MVGSHLNYSHMYDEFYYSVMAQVQYKDFSLLGQFRKVQNNFFGETIKKNENQTAFMAMYTRRNLQAGIGIMFPFTNNYKVGKERISKVAPFRSETFVRRRDRWSCCAWVIHSSSDASTRQATRG